MHEGNLGAVDATRVRTHARHARFYQASTSELFGQVAEIPQSEKTPFHPRSPYAVAKLYAFWSVVNYREAYGLHASNGILFNHESPRRGITFVTRKVTRAAARIKHNLQVEEVGVGREQGRVRVRIDPRYFRPSEVELLLCDASKAERQLGWQHHTLARGIAQTLAWWRTQS